MILCESCKKVGPTEGWLFAHILYGCLEKLGFSSLADFKKDYQAKKRNTKVTYVLYVLHKLLLEVCHSATPESL